MDKDFANFQIVSMVRFSEGTIGADFGLLEIFHDDLLYYILPWRL